MDSLVFPSPDATYKVDSFKELIWVPRKSIEKIQKFLKENGPKTKVKLFKDSIPCLYIPNKQSNICLIYSHGNACDIGEMYESFLEYSLNWKVNVIGYEYPGYGVAKGSASASNIKKDIKFVYQFVTQVLNYLPENVVLFGRSIGTGPSIYMASRLGKLNPKQPGGLILQSPYTTIRDIAVELVGKIGNLAPKMFDNIGNIVNVKCPILFIHGEQDILIPITHSEGLVNTISDTNKNFHFQRVVEADHNEFQEEVDILLPGEKFFTDFKIRDEEAPTAPPEVPEAFYYHNL